MSDGANGRDLIRKAMEREASDIHLTVGQRPHMRCDGELQAIGDSPLTESFLSDFCSSLLTESQRERLERERDIDLSWTFEGRRFRVNAYYQQGWIALALRLLPERIPALAEIGAWKAWQKMKEVDQGLILVTGRTGSGKTTTLAAFIEELNRERSYHIVTLEDPLEYVHVPGNCFISQRELGKDFLSFPQGLRSALREMPDVILVGELRDAETMRTALMAAETGILVLGTLHTKSAAETAMRVEGMFPAGQRDVVREQFASVFTGIFSQQLLPAKDGGRVCAVEVLLATAAARNIIRQGKYPQLDSVMMGGRECGMQTRQMAWKSLYQGGRITKELFERLGDRG